MAVTILIAAGVVTFGNSLSGVFIFDDFAAIAENTYIRSLWPLRNALLAPVDSPVAGRPVIAFSLAVNYAIGGLNVRGYHVFNIAVHILASLALFGLIHRTLEGPPLQWSPARSRGIALTSSLLWLVHPLQTEVVNYLSQRTESVMGLLYLLTMYASNRARTDSARTRWTVMAVAACAAGMAAKEVIVTAPLMVVFYDWVFRSDGFRRVAQRRWPMWLGLAATWVILAALQWGGPRAATVGASSGFPAHVYAASQPQAVLRYLWLAIWPHDLVLDYGIAVASRSPHFVAQATAIFSLIVASIVLAKVRPVLAFPLVWFLAILAPTSSIVPIASEVAAERRMYLPLAALIVSGVAAVDVGLRRIFKDRDGRIGADPHAVLRNAVAVSLAAAAIGWLAFASSRRNRDYRTEETIWRTSVSRWPQPRAQNNLGAVFINGNRYAEAVQVLSQAVQSAPNYARARLNLARAFEAAGDLEASIGQYEEFLRLQPRDGEAHHRVGSLLMQSGRSIEASQHFRETLKIDPSADGARLDLATALLAQDAEAEAEQLFREYLARNPRDARAYHGLGLALSLQDRPAEAVAELSRALALQPSAAQIHLDLGIALRLNGRIEESRQHIEEAWRLDPQLRSEFESAVSAKAPLSLTR